MTGRSYRWVQWSCGLQLTVTSCCSADERCKNVEMTGRSYRWVQWSCGLQLTVTSCCSGDERCKNVEMTGRSYRWVQWSFGLQLTVTSCCSSDEWCKNVEMTGRPYRWVQWLCGLQFLEDDPGKVSVPLSRSYMSDTVQRLRARVYDRLSLQKQLAAFGLLMCFIICVVLCLSKTHYVACFIFKHDIQLLNKFPSKFIINADYEHQLVNRNSTCLPCMLNTIASLSAVVVALLLLHRGLLDPAV